MKYPQKKWKFPNKSQYIPVYPHDPNYIPQIVILSSFIAQFLGKAASIFVHGEFT